MRTRNYVHLSIVALCLSFPMPASAAVHNVTVRNFEFDPVNVDAQIGDTVTWTWVTGFHTVTSGASCTSDGLFFDEPIDNSNPTFSWVIPPGAPSTIPYFCIPHCPIMTGTITVTEGIPTMSEWGMILTALVIAAAGCVIVVRRTRSRMVTV